MQIMITIDIDETSGPLMMLLCQAECDGRSLLDINARALPGSAMLEAWDSLLGLATGAAGTAALPALDPKER